MEHTTPSSTSLGGNGVWKGYVLPVKGLSVRLSVRSGANMEWIAVGDVIDRLGDGGIWKEIVSMCGGRERRKAFSRPVSWLATISTEALVEIGGDYDAGWIKLTERLS